MADSSDTEAKKIDPALLVIPPSSWHLEGALSTKDMAEALQALRTAWNVKDDTTFTRLIVLLAGVFALNGTSDKASYHGELEVNGRDYSLDVMATTLRPYGIRRFARSRTTYYNLKGELKHGTFADQIRIALLANKDMAAQCATNYGVSSAMGHLCFDVANACSNLSSTEVAFVHDKSEKIIKKSNANRRGFLHGDDGDGAGGDIDYNGGY